MKNCWHVAVLGNLLENYCSSFSVPFDFLDFSLLIDVSVNILIMISSRKQLILFLKQRDLLTLVGCSINVISISTIKFRFYYKY